MAYGYANLCSRSRQVPSERREAEQEVHELLDELVTRVCDEVSVELRTIT